MPSGDDANRKNDLAQLMSSARISLLSVKLLVNEVMTSLRQAVLDNNNDYSIQKETPRIKEEKLVLVGGNDLDMENTIDIYDGQKKSWTLSKVIGIEKYYFASVIAGDWMLIIGGLNSSFQSLTSVEYIDLKNGQIHPLKPLNHGRRYFSAVTLHCNSSMDVYAIGGFGNDITFNSVERWNSKTGDWMIIAPLLMAVNGHCASVIENKIYVTGGRTNKNRKELYLNKVQMYSVESDSWTYRAPMIQERCDHSSIVFKGKLFVASGYDFQTSYLDGVEQYDPIVNLWTAFTKLPKPRSNISLCCFQNRILCMGGYNRRYFSDVWEYDEASKSWKASKSLSRERAFSDAHVIPYFSII